MKIPFPSRRTCQTKEIVVTSQVWLHDKFSVKFCHWYTEKMYQYFETTMQTMIVWQTNVGKHFIIIRYLLEIIST